MARVFICYSRADRAAVAPLHRALVEAGYECWFDAFILPGEPWQVRLRSEIVQCDAFVYVGSPASLVSDWCQWELAAAVELGRPIVPARLDQSSDLPPSIAHLHHADLTGDPPAESLLGLLGGLAAVSRKRLDPVPAPANPLGVPSHVAWDNPSKGSVAGVGLGAGLVNELPGVDPDGLRPLPSRPGPFVGIDFGTVASLVATVEDGRPVPIPNRAGRYETPSAVGIATTGDVIVGEAARLLAQMFPERAVLYPKRLLGTRRSLHVDGVSYSPQQLVSYVLRSLVEDAARYLGETVGGAVITVPAYFRVSEMRDLRAAAVLADVPLLRLVAEPTAAALAAVGGEPDRVVAVYDLGGGTFDISIIGYGDGVWEVEAVAGDTNLGGSDYDDLLAEYCITRFLADTGVDLRSNPVARMRTREACEVAKIVLSSAENAAVQVPFVHGDGVHALHLDVPVTRRKYEDLTFHLTDATIEACQTALRLRAGAGPREDWRDEWLQGIDEVLLVGLATRTPSVRQTVERFFGIRSARDYEPDRVVAYGAAIQAGVLDGRARDRLLLDVLGHGLVLATADGDPVQLLEPTVTVPNFRSERVMPMSETQSKVALEIHEDSAAGALLVRMVLDLSDSTEPDATIEVRVDVDANATVDVAASIPGTDVHRRCRPGFDPPDPPDTNPGTQMGVRRAASAHLTLVVDVAAAGAAQDVANFVSRRDVNVKRSVGTDNCYLKIDAYARDGETAEAKLAEARRTAMDMFQVRAIEVRADQEDETWSKDSSAQ